MKVKQKDEERFVIKLTRDEAQSLMNILSLSAQLLEAETGAQRDDAIKQGWFTQQSDEDLLSSPLYRELKGLGLESRV